MCVPEHCDRERIIGIGAVCARRRFCQQSRASRGLAHRASDDAGWFGQSRLGCGALPAAAAAETESNQRIPYIYDQFWHQPLILIPTAQRRFIPSIRDVVLSYSTRMFEHSFLTPLCCPASDTAHPPISPVDGTGPAAQFNGPAGVSMAARDPSFAVVADRYSHRIRRIDTSTGRVNTLAGSSQVCTCEADAAV